MATKYLLTSDFQYFASLWRAGKIVSDAHFDISTLIAHGAQLEPYTGTIPPAIAAQMARASQGQLPPDTLGFAIAGASLAAHAFATVALMVAAAPTLKHGEVVYVSSLDRYFTWVLGSSLALDGYIVVPDADSTGCFTALPSVSQTAYDQTEWYISALGDDEGTGSVDSPLLTFREWYTRTGGHFKDGTTINLVPDPDGPNTWADSLVGVVYPEYAGAKLIIQGELRTTETITAVTIVDATAATNTLFEVTKSKDWSTYPGKLIAKDANTMAWAYAQSTTHLYVTAWFDPETGAEVATPTASTSVTVKSITDIPDVTLQMTDSVSAVIELRYLSSTNFAYLGTGLKLVACNADSLEVVSGPVWLTHSYVTQALSYTHSKINVSNTVITNLTSRDSQWDIESFFCSAGNHVYNGGFTRVYGQCWARAIVGSLYTAHKGHTCDFVGGNLSGATIASVFAVNSGSKVFLNAGSMPYADGTTQDFIIDGATSHVPPLAGGELAVPAAASCKTWAELTGSPFSNSVAPYGRTAAVQALLRLPG